MGVWRKWLLLAIFGVLASPALSAENENIQANVFWYGSDDFQEADPVEYPEARGVVGLFSRDRLERVGDSFAFKNRSLAQFWFEAGKPLCPDTPFRDQPSAASCTGFLVAENVVATAGHCFRRQTCSSTYIVFDFFTNTTRAKEDNPDELLIPKENVYRCAQMIAGRLEMYVTGSDWALLELDRPVTDRAPLALRREGMIGEGERVFMLSHFNGLPQKVSGAPTEEEKEEAEQDSSSLSLPSPSPEPAVSMTTVESDGTWRRPHCTFLRQCSWDEAAKQACAQAICTMSGLGSAGAVFVSASNNPCEAGISRRGYYGFLMDRVKVARVRREFEARVVANCTGAERADLDGLPNAVVDSSPRTFFVSTIDDMNGSSGAPVFNAETREVEGVHVRGSSATEEVIPDRMQWCYRIRNCPDPIVNDNAQPTSSECRGGQHVRVSAFTPTLDIFVTASKTIEAIRDHAFNVTLEGPFPSSLPQQIPANDSLQLNFTLPPSPEGLPLYLHRAFVRVEIDHEQAEDIEIRIRGPYRTLAWRGDLRGVDEDGVFEDDLDSRLSLSQALALTGPGEVSVGHEAPEGVWTIDLVDDVWGHEGNVTGVSLVAEVSLVEEHRDGGEEGDSLVPSAGERGWQWKGPEGVIVVHVEDDREMRASEDEVSGPLWEIPDATEGGGRADAIPTAPNFQLNNTLVIVFEVDASSFPDNVALTDLSLNVSVAHGDRQSLFGKLISPVGMEIDTGIFPPSEGRGGPNEDRRKVDDHEGRNSTAAETGEGSGNSTVSLGGDEGEGGMQGEEFEVEAEAVVFGRGGWRRDPLMTVFARRHRAPDDFHGEWQLELTDVVDANVTGSVESATLSLFYSTIA
uniref:Uncharacterized protein n=1 Tax=Chromera velia CCMP2878 TaxID=1169474 RepID=A0A0G4I2F9_9ALVE|eukprot:Cvel_10383.t1-p1 / transcript=Cvel_10383.t1 / gene=Cvel_10383 / organism=Chromera_velia_CCMP2878 / gene_product=hypothetical protein / transcript_product=hypothetical protein / location=Cvel_scaffold625:54261-58605(-) / protein_length=856 / sequence_SO=supercontig / SO=protein_coding / is_pseudo=false